MDLLPEIVLDDTGGIHAHSEFQVENGTVFMALNKIIISTRRSLKPFLEYQFCSDYALKEAYSIFGATPYMSRTKALEAIQNSPYKPFDKAVMESIIDTIPH